MHDVLAVVLSLEDGPQIVSITPDLPTLQRIVGGYVELVPLSGGAALWVNEEGKVAGKVRPSPINWPATFLASAMGPAVRPVLLVGSAVVLGSADTRGDSTAVPGWVVALFRDDLTTPVTT